VNIVEWLVSMPAVRLLVASVLTISFGLACRDYTFDRSAFNVGYFFKKFRVYVESVCLCVGLGFTFRFRVYCVNQPQMRTVEELVRRNWRNACLTNFRLNRTLTISAHHGL